MSHGEVRTWYMTEEERQAYIAKHPIVPKGQPHGTILSKPTKENIAKSKESKSRSQTRITDSIDKVELHKRFMGGESIDDIAADLNISTSYLHYYIRKQRQLEPERWPHRVKQRERKNK